MLSYVLPTVYGNLYISPFSLICLPELYVSDLRIVEFALHLCIIWQRIGTLLFSFNSTKQIPEGLTALIVVEASNLSRETEKYQSGLSSAVLLVGPAKVVLIHIIRDLALLRTKKIKFRLYK